ncbi:Unknown protein sequence [Pseudomonas syringae pv. maculicola]|nr:Unknown protein sequence [Pseudomonas syringae pv. maculicola]
MAFCWCAMGLGAGVHEAAGLLKAFSTLMVGFSDCDCDYTQAIPAHHKALGYAKPHHDYWRRLRSGP